MSASILARTWSLNVPTPPHIHDDDSAPTSSPKFQTWLTNTALNNRLGAHLISNLLTIVPRSSQTRLYDEGLLPYYNITLSLDTALKSIATQNQIPIPDYPDIPADWREEAAIDTGSLSDALLQQAGPAADLLRFMTRLMYSKEYHWASLVTFLSVESDAYMSPAAPKKGGALAPFANAIRDGMMGQRAGVLREELLRCRSQPAVTGWNENEVKQLTEEHLGLLQAYWA